MTPPDPKPTAPPTVAPASDEEIARIEPNIAKTEWQTCSNCDAGLRSINTPPYLIGTHEDYCILTMWPKVIARIESDRAENDRLRLEAIENAHDYANSLMAHKRKDKELSELRQKLEDMYARVEKTCSDSLEYRTKFAKL